MDEWLTVYDEEGHTAGCAPRDRVHREGLLHRVVHVWIASSDGGPCRLWFQQRSWSKADFPGLYDFAVGGHIGHGEDVLEAALRETGEETGLMLRKESLELLGVWRGDFRDGDFWNREMAQIYLYRDCAPAFAPGEELADMVSVALEDFLHRTQREIVAQSWDGREVTIAPEQWCGDFREFEAVVYPALRRDSGEGSLR